MYTESKLVAGTRGFEFPSVDIILIRPLQASKLTTPMLQRLIPLLSKQVGFSQSQLVSSNVRNYAAAAGSMALVKDLREKSGAPISDVKSALVEANWDPGKGLPGVISIFWENSIGQSCL